jgi:small subunit ribosomal protein S16
VAVKIRLKRMGKIRAPYYRIVVADSRTKRDGRAIEEIGKYHPTEEPSLMEVNRERVQYWLGVGAQPTEQVLAILKVTGDWQTFKGLPGAEGTLRTAAAKVDKKAVFEAAAKEAMAEPKEGATTPKAKRAAKPKVEEAPAETAAETPAPAAAAEAPAPAADEAPAAEAAPADEAAAEEAPAAEAAEAAEAPEAPAQA